MRPDLIKIHVHEHIGSIILNRPEKRNALNRELMTQLQQAFFDLHQERRVRVVVLTGAGPVFCAGMDLGEMLDTRSATDAAQLWHSDADQYRDILETMMRFPKPIIAAVNGAAVAGGAGLMLACDVVVAGEDAKFGLPEPKRGLVAGVVAPLLHFRVGGGQSARLLVTSAVIEAAEAHRLGLFHELHHPDKVWPRAMEIAAECAKGAPESLQMTRRMLNEIIGEHVFTLLSAGAAISATARTTEAAAEGLAAFREKRDPVWP